MPHDLPAGGLELLNIFIQIGDTRTYHDKGPHAVSLQEIEAWMRLHRYPLQPHHIAIIRALDEAWLRHAYDEMSRQQAEKPSRANAQPVTAAIFDAVFS